MVGAGDGLCVRNVWSCDACGYQFEDTVYLSGREAADAALLVFAEQLWQLCDIRGDPPRLVLGEQLCRRTPAGLTFEINVSELLAVVVA
jgi:hypothetical protein